MPAPSVSRRWSGDNLQRTPQGWTATIEYDVAYAASPDDAEEAVMQYAGYSNDQSNPSTHPASSLLYFAGLTSRDEGFHRWIVTANFSMSPLGFVPDPNNPLLMPPTYNFSIGSTGESVDQDAYGNAILNGAGAPLVGASRVFSILSIMVCRNEPVYNPAIALQYVNHVNIAQMKFSNLFTIEPGQALLRNYQPVMEQSQQSPYVRCQYQFDCRAPISKTIDSDGLWDSWKTRILNTSRIGCYTSNGTTQTGFFGRFLQGAFTECSEDVPIYANGTPVKLKGMNTNFKIMDPTNGPQDPVASSYTIPTNVATDTDPNTGMVFLKFCMFPPVDFGGLNL